MADGSVLGRETTSGPDEHLDVLVVGAGLSGVAAGYYLRRHNRGTSFAILEARDAIGGTWDLFRYPGVRSDSDMHTLGYSFRPWPSDLSIVPGGQIRDYIRETARETGVDRMIRFRHRVVEAAWSSADQAWTVDVEIGGEGEAVRRHRIVCGFLLMCSGYYDYAQGHAPTWPGLETFRGRVVHPQFWPDDLDYAGKRVVVIGSGATAVTLIPSMTDKAAHVTMLQRSPTYIVARPSRDKAAEWLNRRLPRALAAPLTRWKNVLFSIYVFQLARRKPDAVKAGIKKLAKRGLGPDFDVETHLNPQYAPWDQRLCLIPDADLFKAIKRGKASIVTDRIARFTETGIALESGKELEADIVVTATGLEVKMLGGAKLSVDGVPVESGKVFSYKGMMLSGVPNFAAALGYTNASWTLKCELTLAYVTRLLRFMRRRGYGTVVPARPTGGDDAEPLLNLNSGYIQRAAAILPRQGASAPWRVHQNYVRDLAAIRFGRLKDGVLQFRKAKVDA